MAIGRALSYREQGGGLDRNPLHNRSTGDET
jgi:hypothetical protein